MVNNTRVSGVWVSSGVGSGVGGGVSADGTVVVPRWVITVSAVILLSRLLVLSLGEVAGEKGNQNQKALLRIKYRRILKSTNAIQIIFINNFYISVSDGYFQIKSNGDPDLIEYSIVE